jgi:hypothetical protein
MKIFTTLLQGNSIKFGFYIVTTLWVIACDSTKKPEQITAIAIDGNMQSISQEIFKEGVDFYATGSDSSWTLSLNFEEDFKFENANGFAFSTPSVEGVKTQNDNVVRYQASVESGIMIIHVFQENCIDNHKGRAYSNKVTVEIKRGIDEKFTIFKGCGSYKNE